jgi:alanine racemase
MPSSAAENPQNGNETDWRARALIDIESLDHNIGLIRKAAPRSNLMAVIKADAYGHGLDIVCNAIHSRVDGFAVATIAEGVQCRKIQGDVPVVVLSELWRASQLETFSRYDLQPVIHNEDQLEWLVAYTGPPLAVWIKFDSGMNRLGIDAGEVDRYHRIISGLKCVRQVRFMSHLANADIRGDGYTKGQLKLFNETTDKFTAEKSLANSAGVLGWPDTHFQWNRPGLILYGVLPFEQGDGPSNATEYGLKPVMQLQARLISTKYVKANQPVGYGGVFRTRRSSRIGFVGLGYGDGYPRLQDQRACVLINGKRAPIIGRVSMDMITVDITDLEQVQTGHSVTLWGHGLPVEEVADWANTIPYELLCKVTPRIPRFAITGDLNG